MPSESSRNQTTLELTESESQLRDLLLGVAAYIDSGSSSDGVITAAQVPDELRSEKTVLRWTGGWVRDKLLGVGSHDIDVAINNMTGEHFGLKMLEYLKPPGMAEKHGLSEQEGSRIVSGLHTIKANPEASKNLETATIRIMGIDLDLVNLRKETYNEASRNPEMEFGTAEEDAMRRDATVNAMFYNLHTQEIEDFTGQGFVDMAEQIIRTPLEPYQTFKDDPLRVLRLIRFASRLDYTIHPNTANAMGNKSIQDVLKIKIKRERVGIELEKMLKGPDPHMALALIHEFGLYSTIFTDPTRELPSQPDMDYFTPAYDHVRFLQSATADPSSTIAETLLRNADEKYLAWVCAAVMPWADAPQVPHSKPSRPPHHTACLVAQEGFKAPNRVSDVVAASLDHSEEIRKAVEQCYKELQSPSKRATAAARDTLGMAIRRWGSTWRTQVLFSLVYEVALGLVSRERLQLQYAAFLRHLTEEKLLDAAAFKPLVNGKDLAKALAVAPGPWMKDALDVVMEWQLRNPAITDPKQAIEEVKRTRQSELPSRLIAAFLSLTLRPLFSQTEASSNATSVRRWKEPGNEYAAALLRWILRVADEADIRRNFALLRVPILQMLDDGDLSWRARACELVGLLARAAPPGLLQTHRRLFDDDLFSYFTYLPTLTPEAESILLLDQVYPALTALWAATGRDAGFLDRLLREGVLAPLSHFPSPSTYPALAALIIANLGSILDLLHINSVKHLPSVLPLLGAIVQDGFAPAHPPLLAAAARALQRVLANARPRIDARRALEMYAWVCKAWLACRGYEGEGLEGAEGELKAVVKELDAVLRGSGRAEVGALWRREKERVLVEKSPLVGLVAGL